MQKNILKKGVTAVLSLTMVLSMGATAFAYTTPGTVASATTNKATLSVGKTLHNTTGKLSAQSFNFKLTPVEAKDGRTMKAITDIPKPTKDTVTIDFSKTEVAKKNELTKGTTFESMTYTKPGYYMYKINEVIPAVKAPGVTYDETSYFVVVYVTEKTDAQGNTTNDVEVKSITSWHNDKDQSNQKPDLTEIAKNSDGATAMQTVTGTDKSVSFGKVNYTKFVNQTASLDVVITKNVKGNLGDRNYDFSFTTKLEGLNPGTEYDYVKTTQGGTAQPATTFTADPDGKATLTYTLKDDENIKINQIPVASTYQTTEAASNHIAKYDITSSSNTAVIKSNAKANTGQDTVCATETEVVDAQDGTVTILFTNTRNLNTITGVPGMDIIVMGVAAMFVMMGIFSVKKKHAYEDLD